ncbi:MAG: hypothetical protein KDD45_11500 [Bdellovibrionales bacterium]|nr:hypothetical protein [Bdellovibrionales bacterium]
MLDERAVKQEEAIEFAHQHQLYYLEASALNGNNVDNAFMTVIRGILNLRLEIYSQVKSKPMTKGRKSSQVMIGGRVIRDQ